MRPFDPQHPLGKDWDRFWTGYSLGLVCSPAIYWFLWPIVTGQWGLL